MATDCEKSHGDDITWTLRAKPAPESIRAEWIGTSWIVEVVAEGTREGKPRFASLCVTIKKCGDTKNWSTPWSEATNKDTLGLAGATSLNPLVR